MAYNIKYKSNGKRTMRDHKRSRNKVRKLIIGKRSQGGMTRINMGNQKRAD